MTARSRTPDPRRRPPHTGRRPRTDRGTDQGGIVEISRRELLKSSLVGAAGVALPLALYRPTGTRAALQGFGLPLPLLPKARPIARNTYALAAKPGFAR